MKNPDPKTRYCKGAIRFLKGLFFKCNALNEVKSLKNVSIHSFYRVRDFREISTDGQGNSQQRLQTSQTH